MYRALACAVILLTVTACAVISPVPPITYLQLRSKDSGTPTGGSPVVVIDAIQMPDYLLRDELLRRRSDHTLRYEPFQRWAEPLDLGIQRVLAENLRGELNTRRILRYPEATTNDDAWRLHVAIHAFETRGERVTMRASGRWMAAGQQEREAAAIVSFENTRSVEGQAAGDIAAALSALLQEFSAALARQFPGEPV